MKSRPKIAHDVIVLRMYDEINKSKRTNRLLDSVVEFIDVRFTIHEMFYSLHLVRALSSEFIRKDFFFIVYLCIWVISLRLFQSLIIFKNTCYSKL